MRICFGSKIRSMYPEPPQPNPWAALFWTTVILVAVWPLPVRLTSLRRLADAASVAQRGTHLWVVLFPPREGDCR